MRIRICNPLRFYCFILLLVCLFCILLPSFFNVYGEGEKTYETFTVRCGDTLWGIAELYKPENVSARNFVRKIMECNDMETSAIYPGSTLLIPVH